MTFDKEILFVVSKIHYDRVCYIEGLLYIDVTYYFHNP